jgi:hypothetical protein
LGDGGAIAPHVAIEFATDDNPLRRDEGSEESGYLRIQPSLRYVVRTRNNTLNLTYSGDYYQYATDYCRGPNVTNCPLFDKASYQDHKFAADGYLEITKKLRATALLEHAILHQPLGTGLSVNGGTLSSLSEPDSFRLGTVRTEVSYGAAGARGEIRAGVTFTDKEFNLDDLNPGREQDLLDLSESATSPNIRLLYRVGTRTQVFGGFGTSKVTGGNSPRDITNYFAGVELDASAITSGSFQLNSIRENFATQSRGDFDYIGWEAEVTWKPRRFSTVQLSGGRETRRGVFNLDDPALATFIGGDIGITTNINVDWRHFWRERFSTLVRLSVQNNDFVGPAGTDTADANDRTTGLRVQGDYNIRRWLDVGAFLESENRSGSSTDREYGRSVIGLTANATF